MDVNEHVVLQRENKAWKVWNLEVQMCMGVYLVVVRTACLQLIST